MKPGPRRDLPHVARAKGSHRKVPLDAPVAGAGGLTCPASLRGPARRMWASLTREMVTAGTWGSECRPLAERYCATWARYVAAEAELAAGGVMLRAAVTGTPYVSPLAYFVRNEGRELLRMEAELGRSPASRGTVHKIPAVPDPDSQWARLRVLQAGKG